MDGVYILNQEEILSEPEWLLPLFVCMVVVFGISTIILGFTHDEAIGIMFGCMTIASVLFIAVIGSGEAKEPTGRYKYECVITNEASLSELLEKYEIVEQRGDIWVLEDKEGQ